jgi:hypothetical protein
VAETCDGTSAACPADGKAQDGTSCQDGNPCTVGEACTSGACVGGAMVTCPGNDQCHTVGACVQGTGCPTPVARADGLACDDGDPCTQADACHGGQCTGVRGLACTQTTVEGVAFCPNASGGGDPVARGWWRQ